MIFHVFTRMYLAYMYISCKNSTIINFCWFIRTPVNLDLQKMEKELEKLEEVWGLVFQWEESWEKYKNQTFWEMETDEMEENVTFLFRYLLSFYNIFVNFYLSLIICC